MKTKAPRIESDGESLNSDSEFESDASDSEALDEIMSDDDDAPYIEIGKLVTTPVSVIRPRPGQPAKVVVVPDQADITKVVVKSLADEKIKPHVPGFAHVLVRPEGENARRVDRAFVVIKASDTMHSVRDGKFQVALLSQASDKRRVQHTLASEGETLTPAMWKAILAASDPAADAGVVDRFEAAYPTAAAALPKPFASWASVAHNKAVAAQAKPDGGGAARDAAPKASTLDPPPAAAPARVRGASPAAPKRKADADIKRPKAKPKTAVAVSSPLRDVTVVVAQSDPPPPTVAAPAVTTTAPPPPPPSASSSMTITGTPAYIARCAAAVASVD